MNELDLNKIENLIEIDFEVLQNINAKDNCYNQPKKRLLKKGAIVNFTGSANNGDVFTQDKDGITYIVSWTLACKSRCPYDKGLIDLSYFKRIKKKRIKKKRINITLEEFNIMVSNSTFGDGTTLDKDCLYQEIEKVLTDDTIDDTINKYPDMLSRL